MDFISLKDAVSHIVDNRGKTCPTSESGIPLIATNCVKSTSLYPTKDKIRYVDAETYETWFRGHPEPGDILFVNKGSPGEVCLVPDPVDFCIAQDMVSLRANEKKIDPSYLFAVLRDRGTKVAIENMHVGTMIPHFKKTDFDKLNLPLPTRSDQQFIGELYLGLSKRIALNQKMNQTLEEIAKAIFKSWFVDFDPVRAKAEGRPTGLPPEISDLFPGELVDSEMGEIPKGWKTFNPHDLVSSVSETYPLKNVDEVIFLNTGDIEGGLFLHSNFSSSHGLPGQAKKSIKKGDILFSEIRPKNKRFALVQFEADQYVVSTKLMVLRVLDNVRPELPYFLLTRNESINQLQHIAENRSGTFPQITFDQLKELSFCAPENFAMNYNPLTHFTDATLVPLYSKFDLIAKENSVLNDLRDTLLPKLISGELRIPDAEKFLDEAGI